MDEVRQGEGGTGDERRRRRRWVLPALLLPVVTVIVIVIAWAVDSTSGGVPRNVVLAGAHVGELSETELTNRVANLAEDFSATPVEIVTREGTYETTAEEIGLAVDQDRTATNALEVDAQTPSVLQPFAWLRSFVTERRASLDLQVSREVLAETIVELQGDDRIPPTEPTVELVDGAFSVVPGEDGMGIAPDELAEALPAVARDWPDGGVIRVEVDRGPIPPFGTEEAAREAAGRAEALVGQPMEIRTSAGSRTVEPPELRSWVRLTSQHDGSVVVELDPARTSEGLRRIFADIDGAPVDARFTLSSAGVPIILPDEPGLVCCADGSAAQVLDALRGGQTAVELELTEGPASFTVSDAESWEITQAVGGNRAWRNGEATTAGPGFTTYHSAGQPRVVNIHRIADMVRGVVVPPGGTFSVNDHVGRRTTEKGFVAAGAIANGQHVDEIGGGISQFATTMFNAAYFAGLDILESQAHSEYFDRYPLGREATMGFPAPDLVLQNSTPFGLMIWTSYTDTSLTVTMYSSPFATAEQTGIRQSMSGACRVVTTTRTRTYPDGRTVDDTFTATYRPGPGRRC